MKKKILFVSVLDSFMTQFLLPYLKMFHDKGYEVHVVTGEKGDISFCDKKHTISIRRSPFKIANFKAIKELKKILQHENFDIIHCHTPMGGVVTRLAAKKARKNGTKVIYTAHGFHFFKGAPLYYWILFYPVEKYLSKFTDTLITINLDDYNLAKQKFKKCYDIQYIPGVGVDDKKFDISLSLKAKQDIRQSLGLKEDDFVLIFPARLDNNKNQAMLIQAISELLSKYPNLHLLLPGKDELDGKLQKLTTKLKLEHNVHLLGVREDIPQLLAVSNLAVSSSHREGLPVNIMEAMCAGLPLLVTDCRGNRDLVKNNYGGKIIKNQLGLEEAIKEFYHSQQKCKKYGEFNKKESKQYALEKIKKQYEEIYFRKKRIVYIRSTAIINDSRAQKEISTLKKEYDVITLGWDRKHEQKKNPDVILFTKKAEYGAGLKNLFNLISFQLWIIKQLKTISHIDCIYACDFDTAFVANKVARKKHWKFIYDIYDYYVDCRNLPSILRNIIEKLDIKTINSADMVIICSEERVKQIKKSHPKKTIVIHNSIDLDDFHLKKGICKTQKNHTTKIVYVGILQDNRLLKEVTENVKNKENLELHIGGFGQYEDYFRELSKKEKNIFFYGELQYGDVLNLENECDVLFATYNPSVLNHRYSAPNKIYEAIALKKPIIVCKNTGIDKMITKNHIGIAINYDGEEFIEAVEKVKIDRSNAAIMAEKYGWHRMQETLLDSLKEII